MRAPFPSPRSPSFRLDTSKAAAAVPRRGASRRAVGMGRCPPSGVSGWARNHRRPRARGRGSAGRGRRMSLGGVCVRARGKSGGAPSGGPTPPLRPPRLVSLAPALGWVGLGTRGWPGGARGGGANLTRPESRLSPKPRRGPCGGGPLEFETRPPAPFQGGSPPLAKRQTVTARHREFVESDPRKNHPKSTRPGRPTPGGHPGGTG